MLEDFTKAIKLQLYERAVSPLSGSFCISWVLINFKTILIFFSDSSITERLDYLQTAFPTTWVWILNLVVYPLISASLFILIYPYPARWAFKYWRQQHQKVKEIQQSIDDVTPIAREEYRSLKVESMSQMDSLQKELFAATERTNSLQQAKNSLEEKIFEISKSLEQKEGVIRSLEEKLKEKDENINSLNKSLAQKKTMTVEIPKARVVKDFNLASLTPEFRELVKLLVAIPDEMYHRLESRHGLLNEQVKVLVMMAHKGGKVTQSEIDSIFRDLNPIEVETIMNNLEGRGLLIKEPGNFFALTIDGKNFVVSEGIIKFTKTISK